MIYISLGSNLGHRLQYLQHAVQLLRERCLKNAVCSPVLETESLLPEGALSSWNIPYLNMVVAGDTDIKPSDMLLAIKKIERDLGRPSQYERWSPRVIDLDILLWDGVTLDSRDLKIPHPELPNRPFLTHLLATMGVKRFQTVASPDCFQRTLALFPKFVGIVNITPDSFSDGGKFNSTDKAVLQIHQLVKEGATIVEIGAQSTRAGVKLQVPEQEYKILKNVLDEIAPQLRDGSLALSLDSFRPTVIRMVLENYPIAWINDVSGELDDETLSFVAEKKSRFCLMHSLTIPADKSVTLPLESDCVAEIKVWAQKEIGRLCALGFAKESLIIDPGIGFGKSPYQDAEIIRRAGEFKSWGVDILIGHSRKSYNKIISTHPAPERDIETLAASAMLAGKVDYLRVHNVADHMRYFVAARVLGGNCNVS